MKALVALDAPRELLRTARSIHEAFEWQARETPQAIALTFNGASMTYAELDRRASILAAHLSRLGAAREVLVALYLDRSFDMVVAILAVLKTGAAYVPIDLSYPQERALFILKDTAAPVFLTESRLAASLPQTTAQIAYIDNIDFHSAQTDLPQNMQAACEDDLAYVIYTSGSTGTPKGVMVTHGNVLRLIEQTNHWYQFGPSDVWPLFHSYAFDVSVWELWGSLLHGGRLVMVPYLITRSPVEFYQLLSREEITVLNQTPSAFRQLIWAESVSPKLLLKLRYVICAGEALELQSLKPWFDLHGDEAPKVINMYGITETTVHSTYRVIRESDLNNGAGSVIGVPIPDLQLYLVDESMKLVPPGEPGEICVSGPGVARGYLNRPELTHQRFLADPFSAEPGARLYRSGDLARYNSSGELEYLGRMDQQVKIRGFRVELGEIESALNSHPRIRESVVVAAKQGEGDKRLVAYVVPVDEMPTVDNLRHQLSQKLPEYMVPAVFVGLVELPLNINGKVDRMALPAPDHMRPRLSTAFVAPVSQTEQILAQIWSDVLQVSSVGVHDNYFELGGDSIRSIRILAKAREHGMALELQDLYQAPTVSGLAQRATACPAEPEAALQPFSLITPEDLVTLPEDAEDAYPITQLQLGMFFRNEMDHASAIYHDVFSYEVGLSFVPDLMRKAVSDLVQRHPILRTSFHLAGFSQPIQVVHRGTECEFTHDQVPGSSREDIALNIQNWIEMEKRRAFDRDKPGLARFHVMQRNDGRFQLFLSFHHSCLDGWSLAAVITELLLSYKGYLTEAMQVCKAPKSRYSHFVELELATLSSEIQRAFWRKKLENAVRGRIPRWPESLREGGHEQRRGPQVFIPDTTLNGLKNLAQRAGVPLKSVLLAAHQKVMSFLYSTLDVTTALITNGRPEARDGEQVAGLFLNATPFRMELRNGCWTELVRQTFRAEQEIIPFRRFPMAEIQKMMGGQRLFETAFDFVHFHVFHELHADPEMRFSEGQYFEANDMVIYTTFMLNWSGTTLEVHIDYDPKLVSRKQAEQITAYYLATLNAMAAHTEDDHVSFSPLSEEEKSTLLFEWNANAQDIPEGAIHELIEAQTCARPNASALSFRGHNMTYRELNDEANRVSALLQGRGVGRGDLVGVLVGRSPAMVAALLGILKAGAAYVPLDSSFPKERLAYMIEDSGACVLLTDEPLLDSIPDLKTPKILLNQPPTHAPIPRADKPTVSSDDLAYVIYTSGSTGKPKGVEVTHGSVVNLLNSAARVTGFGENDKLLAVTTLSFDISNLELFMPLICGGQVEIAPGDVVSEGQRLKALLSESGATFMQATPSTWQMLLAAGWEGNRNLRIISGGEPLKPSLASELGSKVGRVWNFYGPTETTIWSTACEVNPTEPIRIGKPLANTQVYVLSEDRNLVPIGTVGELWIAGAGVARGYRNRPSLTTERFMPNPFGGSCSTRMYRTGDLARWLPDGTIECLGRADGQVKVRGFRIETGEVESVLREHHSIADAVVTTKDDQFGDKRLVGYVISKNGPPSFAELRDFARSKLPFYMVPSQFVLMKQFPRTCNGKLDPEHLPSPDLEVTSQRTITLPRTETERRLADIWKEVLSAKVLGLEDNFFDLGGDSLSATRVFARVAASFETEISLQDLFEHPTIGCLAKLLGERKPRRSSIEPIQRLPR